MSESNRSPGLVHYQKGATAFQERDHEGALEHFLKTVEIDPRFYRGWAYLGMVYHQQDRIDEAIEAYRKCIEVNPDYHKAFNNIGELYRRKGMLDYAAMVFKMATELQPKQAHYRYNLGITYLEIGMLPQAEKALTASFELDESDIDIATELAQVQFHREKYDDATRTLTRFLEVQKEHDREPEIRARLTMLKRKKEEKERNARDDETKRIE
jgi:tetratricopeptide (TPR) repeat protein